MACYRRSFTRYCILASVFTCSMILFFLSLLPLEENDQMDFLSLYPAAGDRETSLNQPGQREILDIDLRQKAYPDQEQTSDEPQEEEAPVKQDEPPKQEEQLPPVTQERPTFHSTEEMDCKGPWPDYPECAPKMEWMARNWEIDKCYAVNGVDGSMCSFQHYLSVELLASGGNKRKHSMMLSGREEESETTSLSLSSSLPDNTVEHWCPRLKPIQGDVYRKKGKVRTILDPLLQQLSENSKFDWIGRRILHLWSDWVRALHTLEQMKPFNHEEKTVLIHIGALTDKAGFGFAENADHGGPLGELVQWSDLIASLFALGHNLEFSTEVGQLKSYLEVTKGIGGCPTRSEVRYHAIFIDIVGLKQFKKAVGSRLQHYKCLFRVLDSFGTEPQFNFKAWKPVQVTGAKKVDYGQTWGNWELNPRQFMTMFPHSPDNSFLGFVVGNHLSSTEETPARTSNLSLVYGKELYMWKDKRKYLDVISRYLDVHATIGTTQKKKEPLDMSIVPGFIHNHGILNSTDLQKLLRQIKLFVGLGFPYEGPAPLEAIANGCFFLNPRLNPPISRQNSDFFAKKPTLRALSSQNPYAEMFIGKPYVYTVDANDQAAVEAAMREIAKQPRPPPYLPYEFTYAGVLERIAIYTENQEFCQPHQWPPASVLEARISNVSESCKDACYREGLVCEPELFSLLNTEKALASHGFSCSQVATEHSVHGPSINVKSKHCSLQQNKLLLSCVGEKESIQRLCPCRAYKKGQVALCVTCGR